MLCLSRIGPNLQLRPLLKAFILFYFRSVSRSISSPYSLYIRNTGSRILNMRLGYCNTFTLSGTFPNWKRVEIIFMSFIPQNFETPFKPLKILIILGFCLFRLHKKKLFYSKCMVSFFRDIATLINY